VIEVEHTLAITAWKTSLQMVGIAEFVASLYGAVGGVSVLTVRLNLRLMMN
jgi:hypothetical protein